MIPAKKYLLYAALAALPVHAGLIVDNGPPTGSGGNEITEWIQAQDFTLGSATDIQGIRFWATPLTSGTYLGSVSWQIYSNAAGSPGSVLFSGNALVTPVDEGPLAIDGDTQLRLDLDTGGAALAAGTYWLGLHNGDLSSTTRSEFYWQSTDPNGTLTGHEDDAPFDGVWADNGSEHAFQLFDTPFATTASPEPASLTLFAGGLGALWLARRRRKA